jgi:glycosyltransferase involved in cell wall biosynthesis
MKVLFVSPSFYPAFHYGGPIVINRAFCEALAQRTGVEVEVLTTDANGPRRIDPKSVSAQTTSYRIRYCRRLLRPDLAPGLLLRLVRMVRRADVVHLNGVYSFTTIPTLILCWAFKKPLAWSPMGALQRWRGTTNKRLKAVWEKICDALSTRELVLMHVTSEEEKLESLEKIPHASVIVIPNGIDIPNSYRDRADTGNDTLNLLYIGRLHPIKGIENLLQALPLVRSNVRLAICGDGEARYAAQLQRLVVELGLCDVVRFHGRVDGEKKEENFRAADLCIIPSFKESFCTVVLEALARQVPVIVSRGMPWERVEEMGCGLWVSNEPRDLAEAIDRAASMPLGQIGRRGKEWVKRDFSWDEAARKMIEQYRRLIEASRVMPQQ